MRIRTGLLLAAALAAACSSSSSTTDVGTSTPADTGVVTHADAAVSLDSGVVVHPDAAPADSGPADAAAADASQPADAAAPDATIPRDAAAADASQPADAAAADAAAPDAAAPDAAALDAAAPDAAAPDATAPADTGPRPDAGFTVDMIMDEGGGTVIIQNGPPGDPATVGCADGQREGFLDDQLFPNVAGCLGTWANTLSLRTSTTGVSCGDDSVVTCASPQDICARGWHICGTSGVIGEVQAIGPDACANAGGGRYVSAISHCLTQSGCVYDTMPTATYPCFPTGWCSEPVCCGLSCPGFGACPSGIWDNATHIPVGTDQGCGAMSARRAGGVICCR